MTQLEFFFFPPEISELASVMSELGGLSAASHTFQAMIPLIKCTSLLALLLQVTAFSDTISDSNDGKQIIIC